MNKDVTRRRNSNQCRGPREKRVHSPGKTMYLDPTEFSFSELQGAVELYKQHKEVNPNGCVFSRYFADKFRCSSNKASMLRAAAKFHYEMHQKGLA